MRISLAISILVALTLGCMDQLSSSLHGRDGGRVSGEGEGDIPGYIAGDVEVSVETSKGGEASSGQTTISAPPHMTENNYTVRLKQLTQLPSRTEEEAVLLSAELSDVVSVDFIDDITKQPIKFAAMKRPYLFEQKFQSPRKDRKIGLMVVANPGQGDEARFILPQDQLDVSIEEIGLALTSYLMTVKVKLSLGSAILWLVHYDPENLGDLKIYGKITIPEEAEPAFSLTISLPDSASAGEVFDVQWTEVSNAVSYNIVVATDKNCANKTVKVLGIHGLKQSIELSEEGSYYVCIEAVGEDGAIIAKKTSSALAVAEKVNLAPVLSVSTKNNLNLWSGSGTNADPFTFNVDEGSLNASIAFLIDDPGTADVLLSLNCGPSNLPDWLSLNSSSRTIALAPLDSHFGSYQASCLANDGELNSNTIYFDFLVNDLDFTPPPPLNGFAAQTGVGGSNIAITFDFPVDVSDYDHILIYGSSPASAAGSPAPACDSGDLLITVDSFVTDDLIFMADSGAPGKYSSLRACIYDASNNLTSSDTVLDVVSFNDSITCDSGDVETSCTVSNPQSVTNNQLIKIPGDLVIASGGSLQLNNRTESFTLEIGGDLILQGSILGNLRRLSAASINITGSIDAIGLGYRGGYSGNSYGGGPGGSPGSHNNGGWVGAAGAGHGGNGGSASNGAGGSPYDLQKLEFGSGGGSTLADGGDGGGYVYLYSPGTISLTGSIRVDGSAGATAGSCRAGGGGSGGSVVLEADTLSGNGVISAAGGNGGTNNCGGGGGAGGRVYIDTSTNNFTGSIGRSGGLKGYTSSGNGGLGTLVNGSSAAKVLFEALTSTFSNQGVTKLQINTVGKSSDWDHFAIRRKAGGTAPAASCDDSGDTLVAAAVSNFENVIFYDVTGSDGTEFSYRLCIYDGSSDLVGGIDSYQESIYSSRPCASGVQTGGGCWYYGSSGQSCTQVCSSRGGYHEATRYWTGSDGTSANCRDVAERIGMPQGNGDLYTGTTGFGAFSAHGCFYNSTTNHRRRNLITTTAAAASHARACACNQ